MAKSEIEIVIKTRLEAEAAKNQLKELSKIEIDPKISFDDVFDEVEKMSEAIAKEIEDIDFNVDTSGFNDNLKELYSELERLEKSAANSHDISWLKDDSEMEELLKAYDDLGDEATDAGQAMKDSGKQGSEEQKKLKKEVEQTTKSMGGLGTEADHLGDALGKASKAASFSEKMAKFGLMANGINSAVSATTNLAKNFVALDSATYKVQSLGAESAKIAPDLKAMSLAMSSEMALSAADIQTASYEALSAGIKATKEDMTAFMGAAAKLAVGGNETIANTVNLLSSMINAYGESAEKTEEYSNILSMTANLGKTSVAEMTSSMANVIPTASAMGFQLKAVGGALALMTSNGIPTAQATTKLNALLIEMQKPSGELEKIMKKTGLSVAQLGEKVKSGDVVGAFKDLDDSFKKAGVSATQAFSSSEAGAAFNVLTKDFGSLKEMMDGVGESSGATQAAYDQMSQSIENRSAVLQNKFENLVTSALDSSGAVGTFAVVGAQTAEKLSPAITAITGMKELFGDVGKQALDWGKSILTKLIPGLAAQAGVTATATGAQAGLNVAMSANPIGGIILAIAALIGVLYLFFTKTDEGKKILDDFNKMFSDIKKSIMEMWTRVQPVFEQLWDTIKKGGELFFTYYKFLINYLITPFQILIKIITTAVGWFANLGKGAKGAGGAMEGAKGAIKGVGDAISWVTGFLNTLNEKFNYVKGVMLAFVGEAPNLLAVLFEAAKYYLNPINWVDGDDNYEAALSKKLGNIVSIIKRGGKEIAQVPFKTEEEKKKNLDPPTCEKCGKKHFANKKCEKPKTNTNSDKTNKEKKTALDLANEEYKTQADKLANAAKQYEIEIKNKALAEGRQLTAGEEKDIEEQKLKLLEDQRDAWIRIFEKQKLITGMKDNKIEIAPKLKQIDKNEINQQWLDQTEKYLDSKMKIKPILDTAKLSEELEQARFDFEKEKIELHIETSFAGPPTDVESLYMPLFARVEQKRDALKNKLLKASEEEKLALEKQMYDLDKRERDLLKDKDALYHKLAEKRIEASRKQAEAEIAALEKSADAAKKAYSDMRTIISSITHGEIDRDKDKDLDKLDAQMKRELAMVGDNEKAKESVQKKYADLKKSADEAAANRKRYYDIQAVSEESALNEKLQRQKLAQLEALKASADASGDKEKSAKYREEIDKISAMLEELPSLESKTEQAMSDLVGKSISAGVRGGFKEAKKAMKEVLADYMGFLKGKIKLFVLDLILESPIFKAAMVAAGPFAPAVAAGAKALLDAGMDAILNPVFNSVLSFGTGGLVTSPTTFNAGDAAVQGGDNKEWILRNDQLKWTMKEVLREQLNMVSNSIKEAFLSSPNQLVARISGDDLLIILERAKSSQAVRYRI